MSSQGDPMKEDRESDEIADLAKLQSMVVRGLVRSEAIPAVIPAVIDEDEFERAARTLIRKRMSQTQSLLPLSSRELEGSFRVYFQRFAQTYHFNGRRAIALDGLHFSGWMLKRTLGFRASCIEALRWEHEWCRLFSKRVSLRFRRYHGHHPEVPKGLFVFLRLGSLVRCWKMSS